MSDVKVRAGWYVSPSGHPTHAATPGAGHHLVAAGYEPVDEQDVAALLDGPRQTAAGQPFAGAPRLDLSGTQLDGADSDAAVLLEHQAVGDVDEQAVHDAVNSEATGPHAAGARQQTRRRKPTDKPTGKASPKD